MSDVLGMSTNFGTDPRQISVIQFITAIILFEINFWGGGRGGGSISFLRMISVKCLKLSVLLVR